MSGSCFTGTLQTKKQNYGLCIRAFELQINFGVAQKFYDSVIDDFCELLARINRAENLFALSFLDCGIYEAAYNTKVDIGFEQSHFNLLNSFFDIFFSDF